MTRSVSGLVKIFKNTQDGHPRERRSCPFPVERPRVRPETVDRPRVRTGHGSVGNLVRTRGRSVVTAGNGLATLDGRANGHERLSRGARCFVLEKFRPLGEPTGFHDAP